MGVSRRVFHNGSQITGVEHRADEEQLGASAYKHNNVPDAHQGESWFIQDVAIFDDADGIVPWEALLVNNPNGPQASKTVRVDATIRNTKRQEAKDRTIGAGGRRDALSQKLANDTITDVEIRELLRLERGL